MIKLINKLKDKWGITSNIDFILIMVVFSCAGMMVSVARKPIFSLLGLTAETPLWIKTLVYIPLIIPLYQVSLIVFGFLLGQFGFFWEKEKQMGRFLRKFFKSMSSKLINTGRMSTKDTA